MESDWSLSPLYNNNPQFSETRQVIYDQELQENTILVPGTTLAEICTAYANRTEIILSEHENSEPICWEEADQYNSEIINVR